MKILFLALDVNLKSNTGDAVHVREEVASLAKIGNEVTLIAPYSDDPDHELKLLQNQSNINLYFIKPKKYLRNLWTTIKCKEIAKYHGSEIIYERRFSPKNGYLLGKLLRIPFVLEINGSPSELAIQDIAGRQNIVPISLKKLVWIPMFKSVNRFVIVSHKLKSALSEEFHLQKDKIEVIYNGANTELFKPMDSEKCKEELGLSKEYRYVGFIGALAPWQGVEQLIEIAPKVMDKIPEARIIIVGDGTLRSKLEKSSEELGIRDKIIFTGFVPYESVPKYINAFEVCVAPFSGIERNVRYSFSAIKLYEYMACGKPIVTTDVVGIKREIRDQNLGKMVEADDLGGLISNIIELMQDSKLRSDIGNRARAWVASEHSWKNVAKRIEKVCENVLDGVG
jgi:glycosyltransferase involved in cell wall biosynthesis